MTTIAGGMRLGDYLPTRTFELVVHTADLATALDVPPDVPATAAAQALHVVAELAVADGLRRGRSCSQPPADPAFRTVSRCSDAPTPQQSPHLSFRRQWGRLPRACRGAGDVVPRAELESRDR